MPSNLSKSSIAVRPSSRGARGDLPSSATNCRKVSRESWPQAGAPTSARDSSSKAASVAFACSSALALRLFSDPSK